MKYLQRLLLLFSLLLVMTACQPALKEFQPTSNSLFKITFSYPASWVWEEERPYDELSPGEEPPPSELIVLQDGSISIQVYKPADPQAQMQEWMNGYLKVVTQPLGDDPTNQIYYLEDVTTLLRSDTTIQIDGYDARWLTVYYPLTSIGGDEWRPHLQEVIYLLTGDRFYTIDLSVRETEIDGRLHKEFKKMIKTIKILQ
jgi:hypothetical protein